MRLAVVLLSWLLAFQDFDPFDDDLIIPRYPSGQLLLTTALDAEKCLMR